MLLLKIYNGLTALIVIGTSVTYFIIARSRKMEDGKAKGLLIVLPSSILVMTIIKDLCVVFYLMVFLGINTVNMPFVGPIGKVNLYYYMAGLVATGWFPLERSFTTFKNALKYIPAKQE